MHQTPEQESLTPSWNDFCASRAEYLTTLAITVAQGVKRQDTAHPAFCGCIDWHSCVHGVYALLVTSRLLDDPQWAEIADSRMTPATLDAEMSALRKGELDHERPYGYSWLLKLALEREQWNGKTDLLALAHEVALRLEQWIFSLSREKVLYHAQHRAYGNLSWAVLNLYEWAQFKEEHYRIERLAAFTREYLLSLDAEIPCTWDEKIEEFFPASLHRTRVILAVLPGDDATTWVKTYIPDTYQLEPVSIPSTPHAAGLNFSRSWGLWDVWKHTGDSRFRDHYVRHLITHIESPKYWRDNYQQYSHWVAQFGIYAIALSFDQ